MAEAVVAPDHAHRDAGRHQHGMARLDVVVDAEHELRVRSGSGRAAGGMPVRLAGPMQRVLDPAGIEHAPFAGDDLDRRQSKVGLVENLQPGRVVRV
ncbi:hypothetical protein [Burkholderia plantarii]|uniref:hypothetical protein n=1 Tax=Burkholderia plantarii TaxID=41899 RepID=UPI0005AF17EA|nr:hypothetical protein [Burkholderia plantarii]